MKKIFFLILLVVSNLVSAQDANSNWVTEEVLKQLDEIRRDVKSIKSDMTDLKSRIEGLENKVVAGMAAAPAAPPNLGDIQRAKGSVSIEDEPVLGSEKATIAIVEFSDYQCPFCARFSKQTLPQLKAKYIDTGKVKFVMKDFPLGFHPQALPAAVAANCAGEQGKYWEFHDQLFVNTNNLSEENYRLIGKKLDLNIQAFELCRKNQKIAQEAKDDMAEGSAAGVQGTPAFFIGKVKQGKLIDPILISGARPISAFEKALENLK